MLKKITLFGVCILTSLLLMDDAEARSGGQPSIEIFTPSRRQAVAANQFFRVVGKIRHPKGITRIVVRVDGRRVVARGVDQWVARVRAPAEEGEFVIHVKGKDDRGRLIAGQGVLATAVRQ